MSTGTILVNIFNGQRIPLGATRLLLTALDGRHRNVVRTFVDRSSIELTSLEVRDNLEDNYTVLVSAKDHSDAGFTPIKVSSKQQQVLDLMMLRRQATFLFHSFDDIARRPDLHDLHAFLCGDTPADARSLYERLVDDDKPALACLLNITTALEQMKLAPAAGLDQNPLRSFKALHSAPRQDRVFAWVDARFLARVRETRDSQGANGLSRLTSAPATLHPGATDSYKQTDFGEGNVQLTFHEGETRTMDGVECMKVEVDIDYFKDTAAHIMLEVVPAMLKEKIYGKDSAKSLTDPRVVYGLRWIAGRRIGRDFEPPYTIN
jgi:hypothetical protein